jgi:uncharacterized protein
VKRAQAFLLKLQSRTALALLWIYKRVLGPAMHAGVPGACCFQPTCSEYAAIAIAEHGMLRGGAMAAGRVLRCHPLNRGGFDPVPAKRDRGAVKSDARTAVPPQEWPREQISGSRMTRSNMQGIR